MFGEVEIIALTLVAAALAATSQYFMKKYVHKFQFDIKGALTLLKNRGILVSIGLYFFSAVFYLLALNSGELDFVYPIFASTFIFVLIISAVMFREHIGKKRLLGVLLVVFGIVIIAMTY